MDSTSTQILLIHCADQKGLVHHVTGVLFRHGLNVVSNGEFVDADQGRFFMRTEVEGECDSEAARAELAAALPPDAELHFLRPRKKRVVLLASREPHCVGDLLLRHEYGELNFEIQALISNHPDLECLAARFGTPFHCVPARTTDRADHERKILKIIRACEPDYLVLAKYMRILSPEFVSVYPWRAINIHHSFLPAFAGANPYRQAYRRGVKIIGATAHFVTDDLDQGPIIAQNVIPVDHTHGPADMARAGREIERTVLAEALRLVFDERVFVLSNRTIIFD